MENQEDKNENIPVKVIQGGPLLVTGAMEVTLADGSTVLKETRASFCRCGQSQNQPFCDGVHKGLDWEK